MASAPGNSVGQTAGNDPLSGYAVPDRQADLFTDEDGDVADSWRRMGGGLATRCGGRLGDIHERLARETTDLGMTFRLSGDSDERPWPVSPMPLLIGTEEWAALS